MTIEIEEEDRQMLLLALALTRRLRPGWDYATRLVAVKLKGEKMFDDFWVFNENVPPQPSRLDRGTPPTPK